MTLTTWNVSRNCDFILDYVFIPPSSQTVKDIRALYIFALFVKAAHNGKLDVCNVNWIYQISHKIRINGKFNLFITLFSRSRFINYVLTYFHEQCSLHAIFMYLHWLQIKYCKKQCGQLTTLLIQDVLKIYANLLGAYSSITIIRNSKNIVQQQLVCHMQSLNELQRSVLSIGFRICVYITAIFLKTNCEWILIKYNYKYINILTVNSQKIVQIAKQNNCLLMITF